MLTIQGHLTKAWAHLNEAHEYAWIAGNFALAFRIGQAIEDVETATKEQRQAVHPLEVEVA